jgi:hypothetical protein
MVHYKCDLCGKELTPVCDLRYVVRISAYPGGDPDQITEEDLEEDHMEAVAEMIRRDESPGEDDPINSYRAFRFDLCGCCHKKYLSDPLGRDLSRVPDFSEFSKN